MKPAIFLIALAPVVLADSRPRTYDLTPAIRSPAASIPEVAEHVTFTPDPDGLTSKRASRHVLQARSEGTLGQTPWIGMAIGLTVTALTAAMLG